MAGRRHGLSLLATLSSLALASCGGGGTGSTAPATGGTAPSPAPTPSPAPVPAPTPSPTYAMATDFSADRDYPGWSVRLVSAYTAAPAGSPPGTLGTTRYSATLADETRAAGFIYVAATKTYTSRWFTDERSFGPAESILFDGFLPVDRVGTDFARGPFRISPSLADYTRYTGGFSWSIYTGNGNSIFDSEIREHLGIYGVTTQPSDLPGTTTAATTYRPFVVSRLVNIGSIYVIGGEEVTLSVDWSTGNVTGTWLVPVASTAPAGSAPLTFAISGRLNLGSSRMSGTISGSGFSGTFTGAVFGPRAQEIGFAYALSNGSNGLLIGTTGGRKN